MKAELPEDAIDIGNGTWITRVVYGDDNEWVGINEWHYRPDGGLCGGWAPFTDSAWTRIFTKPITSWEVLSREPLTLSPSLLCRSCGHHGFIREGRWVPA